MKRRMTTVALIFALMMIVLSVNAAAADDDQQPIPVTPTELVHPEQTAPKVPIEITDKDPVIWENYRGKIYELTLPEAGTLVVTISPYIESEGTEVVLNDSNTFFKTVSKGAESWNTGYHWYGGITDDTCNFQIDGGAGRKYYIAVMNDAAKFSFQASIQAAFYAAKGRTIELGKSYLFGGGRSEIGHYDFKFTAKKSGYINIDFFNSNDDDPTVSLLDQNKKRISGEYTDYLDGDTYFGVQKGKTYYLRLFPRGLPEYGPYRIWTQAHEVKEKSGASRKKAVLVKKNKTVKGYILPGKKTSDWYKIKVTKKKNVKFTVKNMFSDQCYFDIYNKKGKKLKTKQKVMTSDTDVLSKTRTVRLAKGTYYIKVYNKTKGDSGGYTLKWK